MKNSVFLLVIDPVILYFYLWSLAPLYLSPFILYSFRLLKVQFSNAKRKRKKLTYWLRAYFLLKIFGT